ncbi:MAG: hypothetical protein ACOCSK_00880, partial [Rhodothermales bacterium]
MERFDGMADQPHLYAAHSFQRRLAGGISYVVNPLVMPVTGVGLLAYWGGTAPADAVRLTLIGLLFLALVPTVILLSLLKAKRIETIDIRVRERRLL